MLVLFASCFVENQNFGFGRLVVSVNNKTLPCVCVFLIFSSVRECFSFFFTWQQVKLELNLQPKRRFKVKHYVATSFITCFYKPLAFCYRFVSMPRWKTTHRLPMVKSCAAQSCSILFTVPIPNWPGGKWRLHVTLPI